ncbi:Uncharacterised protein [Streptococcus pyogenes]|uniref:hypothetical protein n=1 Tax=Streptococcus pyogenes TaxID=1314 RepID=UPI0010A10514|nr:hypothetical protein [Streptococcus pyogenes]VGW00100.1 Uncharacterised protein [Streptococcus pyogenes]
MRQETKRLISYGMGYLAAYLFVQNNFFSKFLAVIIIVGLVFVWRNNLFQWIKLKYELFKHIRNRDYFFVTEKGYKTDLQKRRELGNAVYALTNIAFIIVVFIFSIITKLFDIQSMGWGQLLIIGALYIAMFGIVLAVRNYLTGLYYYLLPWLVIVCTVDYVGSYSSIEAIVIYIIVVLISYIILTILLPLHSLRKITSSTWIFGVLTTLLVPLLLEYIFKYYMLDTLKDSFAAQPITIPLLESANISSDILSFVKEHPGILDIMNRFRELSVSYELNSATSELSVVRFLVLASYSLGTIIITLKIKLGESKAKDICSRIKLSSDVQYCELRDCIFYGGEKYENRIMGNEIFENIILSEEGKYDKYVESTWWIKYPSQVVRIFILVLKKLI